MQSTFKLNGSVVPFEPGQTILQAAASHGVQIPTLCHLHGTIPTGVCGVCVVELKGFNELHRACVTEVQEGMDIRTESKVVRESRKAALERLIESGQHNCLVSDLDVGQWTDFQVDTLRRPWHDILCPAYGSCKLQDLAIAYGVKVKGRVPAENEFPVDDSHPMLVRDFSRCIRCGRCIKACNEIQVNLAIPHLDSADKEDPIADRPYPDADYSRCVHCGECVQACPVGALFEKKAFGLSRPWEVKRVRTTCPYCGVGCQQWLHVKDGKIVKVSGVEGAEPNQGRLCVKGRFGYDFIYSEERLKTPLIREGDTFREASWDEALDLVAEKFKAIIASDGPDAIAGVSCARSINEDSYQMQKLFRAVFGTNSIDHCART